MIDFYIAVWYNHRNQIIMIGYLNDKSKYTEYEEAMFMNNKINLDGKRIITIVESGDTVISENDSEMDIRARCAVKSAIEKAEICKKPVAKYDAVLKKAYLEFANGERKYV